MHPSVEQLPVSLDDKLCTRTQTVDGLGSDIEQLHSVGLNKHGCPLTFDASKAVPIAAKICFETQGICIWGKRLEHVLPVREMRQR
jgi:hypothetical protein